MGRSVRNAMPKKRPVVELEKLKFIYITVVLIAKAGPGSDYRPDHPPVQTNSSSP